MSCFAGLLRTDGTAPRPDEVAPMLVPLRPRAPDGEQIACSGPAALAQLHLRTGSSRAEAQPVQTLDGEVFVCADARIDARQELVASLRAAGRDAQADAPHAELILHAYHAFGEQLADHLLGDFAFALWDARQQKLVCARDHLGIRPFYYAQLDGCLAFASQPDALLRYPGVSRALDPQALADFLLFSTYTQAEASIYAQVRCLPAASLLVASPRGVAVRRYWSLPARTVTPRASEAELVEQFRHLLGKAVADRLPDGPLGLQLSGGMDSTSIAALAALTHGGRSTGYHLGCLSLRPDHPETPLARMAASHVGVNLVEQDVSDTPLLARCLDVSLHTPAPSPSARLAAQANTLEHMRATGARVLLSGWAADAVLSPSPRFFATRLLSRHWADALHGLAGHVRRTGSLRGTGLRLLLRRQPAPLPEWRPPRPDWVTAMDTAALGERWESWWRVFSEAAGAAEQIAVPGWGCNLQSHELLPAPVQVRYPFLDLRLVVFLLGLPPLPLAKKRILREAMRGLLPETIRTRPKQGLGVDLTRELVTSGNIAGELDELLASGAPGVDWPRYRMAWSRYSGAGPHGEPIAGELLMLPLTFAAWMQSRRV